ncbi:MAG TPA: hypothetical protein VKA46_32110 [Gemmataceae bacterium]|nr:hypothetical protein [Gemmataceae bacterium]
MPGAIDPNRTVDEAPSDPLDAGLAVAFGADSGPPLPVAGSVVQGKQVSVLFFSRIGEK